MTSHPIPQELDPGLTEAEAAAAIGWSIPNLRSYRERWAAGRVAEALTHAEREAILALGKAGTLAPPVPPGLVRHKLVRPVDPPGTARPSGSVELTQRGREVLRRLRAGRRQLQPPPSKWWPGLGRRYPRAELAAWLREHPEITGQDKRLRSTVSTDQAAAHLGIQPATLKSLRSQAGQAQARIDAGEALPGDRARVRCAPPHVLCGAEKRYRVRDLDRWLAKHRPDRGADPLCEQPPEPWGRLLTPEQLAARMGIAPSCLAGYRLRCRRALRWLALHPEAGPAERKAWEAKALLMPPHVLVGGRVRYRAEAVDQWIVKRQAAGL